MLTEKDFPTIDEIAVALAHIPAHVEHESEEPHIDVRLQVWDDGQWAIHTGDASYDQDHRGFWGAGCVIADDTPETLRDLAEQLRDDAIECTYMDGAMEEDGASE